MATGAASEAERQTSPILVNDVSHAYLQGADGTPLETLVNVSLEVQKGELVCLIGPSGCGKSTLLNIIGSLVKPTAGSLTPTRRLTKKAVANVFRGA